MFYLAPTNIVVDDASSSNVVTILSIALIAVLVLLVISIYNAMKLEKERKKLDK